MKRQTLNATLLCEWRKLSAGGFMYLKTGSHDWHILDKFCIQLFFEKSSVSERLDRLEQTNDLIIFRIFITLYRKC